MRLSSIMLLAVLFTTVIPGVAVAAPTEDCIFSDSFAMRSGQLPFAGTLDQQVAASMDNIFATSDRFIINNTQKIGGLPAVRITTTSDDGAIQKILYVNKGDHSYQLNLSANKATFARQRKNLRLLLRRPFDGQAILCQ